MYRVKAEPKVWLVWVYLWGQSEEALKSGPLEVLRHGVNPGPPFYLPVPASLLFFWRGNRITASQSWKECQSSLSQTFSDYRWGNPANFRRLSFPRLHSGSQGTVLGTPSGLSLRGLFTSLQPPEARLWALSTAPLATPQLPQCSEDNQRILSTTP